MESRSPMGKGNFGGKDSPLQRICVVAMWPFVKLLWSLVQYRDQATDFNFKQYNRVIQA